MLMALLAEPARQHRGAVAIFLLTFLAYNANGREIGSYDSAPTALAARELLLRGTLTLNHVVGATPEYATRWGFIQGADGSYRSVYSPVPSVAAAVLMWPLARAGIVDLRAPLAHRLIAKATASILVSAAAVLVYLASCSFVSRRRALAVAFAFSLGTGLWSTASQTLWQTETTVFGLALATLALVGPSERATWRTATVFGVGLMLAGMARPQVAPAIAVLLVSVWWRWRWSHAALATLLVGSGAAGMAWLNGQWFGHPLGPLPLLSDVNGRIHATASTFGLHSEALAGLLVSPSRGLLVFSPVVLIALAAMPRAIRLGWKSPFAWIVLAVLGQYLLYASYSVWWGGHTFGPRYLLDLLPLLAALGTLALTTPWPAVARFAASAALTWSVGVAATGAFCYPHDAWNTDPIDVDRHHRRLWDVKDNQIVRCWNRGTNPQNFSLFSSLAVRRP